MSSSKPCKKESEKGTADAGQTLASLNDLYSLELSQAFAQAVEAGMIQPEVKTETWAFHIEFCPQHQMVLLPTCPGCGNPTA